MGTCQCWYTEPVVRFEIQLTLTPGCEAQGYREGSKYGEQQTTRRHAGGVHVSHFCDCKSSTMSEDEIIQEKPSVDTVKIPLKSLFRCLLSRFD